MLNLGKNIDSIEIKLPSIKDQEKILKKIKIIEEEQEKNNEYIKKQQENIDEIFKTIKDLKYVHEKEVDEEKSESDKSDSESDSESDKK